MFPNFRRPQRSVVFAAIYGEFSGYVVLRNERDVAASEIQVVVGDPQSRSALTESTCKAGNARR